MDVQVHKTGQNQLVAVVLHRDALIPIRQRVENTCHGTVLTDQVGPGMPGQLPADWRIEKIAFDGKGGLHGNYSF